MSRPDRDEWHLDGARWVSQMADCTRRKVGAIIVLDKRIIGLGYNGGRPGGPSCLAGECPRGRHYQDPNDYLCGCGNNWPCPDSVESGVSYDKGTGVCIATHAEDNAVDDAKTKGHGRMPGGVMYVTCAPCDGCVRLVRNKTDIEAIIWPEGVVALP